MQLGLEKRNHAHNLHGFMVKVKVKGHVMRALSWILGMSYSVIDGLVAFSRRYIFPTKLLYQIITSGFYQWLFIDIETDDPE